MNEFRLIPKQEEITVTSTIDDVIKNYPNHTIKAFDGFVYIGICSKCGKPINASMDYITLSNGDLVLEEMI